MEYKTKGDGKILEWVFLSFLLLFVVKHDIK
jgi:hypothetical protein